MNLPPKPINEIDEGTVEYNRARICEEAAQGIFELMTRQGVNRTLLAKLLDTEKSRISLILSGEQNFQLKTIADIFLVLGRSVHITLGADIDEMRIPVDETDTTNIHSEGDVEQADVIAHIGLIGFESQTVAQESYAYEMEPAHG